MRRSLLVLVTLLWGLLAWGAAAAQDESEVPPWERTGDDDDSADEGEGDSEDEDDPDRDHEDEDDPDRDHEDEDDPDRDHEDEDDYEDDREDDRDPEDEDEDDDEYEDDEDDYAPRGDPRDAALDPVDVYRRDRLKIWRYRTAEEYPNALAALFRPRVRWGVRSEGGTPWTPLELARFIGDKETARKVAGQQVGWISLGSGLTAAGIGILVGGTATYAVANSREEEGRSGGRRGDLQAAEGALTAGLLLGPILVAAGTSVTVGMVRRTRQVARYYEREDAEDAVEDYNLRLMRSLDLDWEDVDARDLRGVPVELRLAVGPALLGLSLRF